VFKKKTEMNECKKTENKTGECHLSVVSNCACCVLMFPHGLQTLRDWKRSWFSTNTTGVIHDLSTLVNTDNRQNRSTSPCHPQ